MTIIKAILGYIGYGKLAAGVSIFLMLVAIGVKFWLMSSDIATLTATVDILRSKLEGSQARESACLLAIERQNEGIEKSVEQLAKANSEYDILWAEYQSSKERVRTEVIYKWNDNKTCENGAQLIYESHRRIWDAR